MTHEPKYIARHQSIILCVGNFVEFFIITNFSRNSDLRELLPGVGQVSVHILADDGLLVGAGHIVPLDS